MTADSPHLDAALAARAAAQQPAPASGFGKLKWMDLLWLAFLAALAVLPPIREPHKQLILLAIGILQLTEGRLIAAIPRRGRSYVVLLKILLSALLLSHTSQLGINSSYYPIFYLPVVTAAVYFGPGGTLLWTLLASAAYCSYLYPALQQYVLTASGAAELVTRNLFFFLAAIIVNRFVMENRRQTQRFQKLAEELAETNRRLERAQAEARRSERLAALGQLSAGLAHEIRNPLGIIKGSAEMLNQRAATAEPLTAELAGYISSEVNRLSELVSRFLDFARPLRLELLPRSLPEIVDRALQEVAANWTGPEVTVERRYAENLPAVPVDESFCDHVFVNLAQNAYEAMSEAGGGTLRVSIGWGERNGRRGLEVRFADSGPGVPPDLREQIFNPFMTTKKSGVGLGLAIVSKIMDGHGGSVALAEAGQGACLTLFFPLADQTAASLPLAVQKV
jgi:two-component system, NtrC family, sensor histidine kinase HydH